MNKPLLHRGVALAVASLVALSLAACGEGDSGTDGHGASALLVASPAPNSMFTFNEVVARELGFYTEEGITVELAALSDAVPAAGLVQNGQADAGLVAASDALAAAARTDELALPYDERTGGTGFISGIVTLENSGIGSLADLKGKNIGLASPDQDLAFTAAALKHVGLTLDDVETTVVGAGGPSVAAALTSGRIAAFTGTINDFALFEDAGLAIENVTPEGLEGLPVGGYIVRAADLEKSEDLIKFFRALAKGTYVSLERPEITEKLTRKVAPDQWREPEAAKSLLESLYPTLQPFDGKNFGEVKPERWKSSQDLLLETGAMEQGADLDRFLRTDLLTKINDWDRTAVLQRADAWLAEHKGD